MAGSVNKVILIGNLGRDPDVRSMQNGSKVANLAIATSESWKDKSSGERKEKTEWHRVVIFNEALIGVAERYLKKGSKVYIEGQLESRKWNDAQTGQEKYTTEIVLKQYRGELTMLDGRGDGGNAGGGGYVAGGNDTGYGGGSAIGGSNTQGNAQGDSSGDYRPAPDMDDDIPF